MTDVVVAVRTAEKTVHLAAVPAPQRRAQVSTLCGALLAAEQIKIVEPGTGMPCTTCLIHRALTEAPVTPPVELAPGRPTPVARRATPQGYAALGWPVSMRGNQVLLALGTELVALILPTRLAEQAMTVLTAQARPVPVLLHPHASGHRIVLATEPFGIELPWPLQVSPATGHLPLPPTLTPNGPVTWAQLPDAHTLSFCREIDLFDVVRRLVPTPPKQ